MRTFVIAVRSIATSLGVMSIQFLSQDLAVRVSGGARGSLRGACNALTNTAVMLKLILNCSTGSTQRFDAVDVPALLASKGRLPPQRSKAPHRFRTVSPS